MRRPAVALSLNTIVVAVVVALSVMSTLGASSATAASYSTSDYASQLLGLVNQARGAHGLPPLVETTGTDAVAAAWTNHLAADRALSHNPGLAHDLAAHGSSTWHVYGENVGVADVSSPDELFRAYMNSPEHRDNILTRAYRYVGVAVVFTGSRAWNTFDFVDSYGIAAPARRVTPVPVHAHTWTSPHRRPAPAPAAAESATVTAPRPGSHPVSALRPTAHRHHSTWAHVRGLHAARQSGLTSHIVVISAPAPAAYTPVALAGLAPSAPSPRPSRELPLAVGLAVLVLVATARRWLLIAVRP